MIQLYRSHDEIPVPRGCDQPPLYCAFDGEDRKIAGILFDHPKAQALLHLIIEGYLAASPEEREHYWRDSTGAVVDWMIKKGIVDPVC